jgi:hypothetical protein
LEISDTPVKYSYARGLLADTVEWLGRVDAKTTDAAWEDKTFDVAECISELQLRRHTKHRAAIHEGLSVDFPVAISTLKEMLLRIRNKDQTAALEMGRLALAKLPLLSAQ